MRQPKHEITMAPVSTALATISLHLLQYLSYTRATATYFDDDYYHGSGDDYSTSPSSFTDLCYKDADCDVSWKPYCCMNTNRCCYNPPYRGAKNRCTHLYKYYTGIVCPQNDHSKIYCCHGGYKCCNKNEINKIRAYDERGYNEPGKDSINKSGVNSIGAIAGFIFLAVIVVATLLTLATRYIKIKFRREHRRAPMHSTEYIEAVNRRANNDENRNEDQQMTTNDTQNHSSQVFYIQPITDNEDDEDGPPPPTYAEAINDCPVVSDERRRETHISTTTTSNRFQVRPPYRPTRSEEHSMRLPVFKEMNTINHHDTAEEHTITLPKVEDSYV